MTKKQKHTALPWRVEHAELEGHYEIVSVDDDIIAEVFYDKDGLDGVAPHDAALIVRAVNSHHAMLEALEALTTACEIADNKEDLPDDIGGELLTKARAAIQLGRG